MTTMGHQSSLTHQLEDMASALEVLDLGDHGAGSAAMSADRDRLVRSIRTYSIPRLSGDSGVLLVVFAGPTGSGKSTLINSLAGLEFSETGPLRPTTTRPVVLAASQHVSEFARISGIECDVIEGGAPILSSIALVDTPDLDSTSVENRAKAEILLDNADVVVFATSALRYADLVPWEVLRRAASRGAPVINVLNRLGAGSVGAVTDFRSRLMREGLDAEVIRVPEHHIQPECHRLPGVAVRELQRRILARTTEIVDDQRKVVDRVVRSTARQVVDLAKELESLLGSADEDKGEVMGRMLRDAAQAMDLTSLCEGLCPADSPDGVVTGLIWEWRNRLSEDAWRRIAGTMERRLTAMVEGDIRRAGEEASVGPMPSQIVKDVRSATSSLAQEWLSTIEGLTGERRLGGWLGALVFADCALNGRRSRAFDRFFEDASLIAKARQALVVPVERVYDQVGSRMRGRDSASLGHDDLERLRQLAAAVSARSHFADA